MNDAYQTPDSWSLKYLDQIASKITDGAHFSPVPQEHGELIANVKDMGESHIDYEACTKITRRAFDELKKQNCSPYQGDILLSKDGTIGKVILYKDNKEIVVLSSIAIIRLDKSVSSDFVKHVLSSFIFDKQLYALQSGSALKRIVLADIRKLTIPLPTKLAQDKIAKILTTIDQLIEKTQSLIDKHTAIKQGMMADLFTRGIDLTTGQLRPTVKQAPHLYKETELGWVPKDWELYPITDLSIGGLKNGYFKKPELVGSGYKLINVSELYQEYGIDISLDSVERVQANIKDYEKYKVEIGDLFFTRSSLVLSGIAKCNIVRDLPELSVYECHVMRLKPNKSLVNPDFLALYSQTKSARDYLMARAKQVTMTTIAQPDIQNMPIPKPSLEEQTMIVRKITKILDAIKSEEKYAAKLKDQKNGLMQDLLTGKVSV